MNSRWIIPGLTFNKATCVKELAALQRPGQVVLDLKMHGRLPETEESRAQRMAQEVREKNPGMQVQRRTRREA